MWMISDPASVSWSWATSTSSGPMPARSYASREASTLGLSTGSPTGKDGLCTSNAPSLRLRREVERTRTGFPKYLWAWSARHITIAAAPSFGPQYMNWRSG